MPIERHRVGGALLLAAGIAMGALGAHALQDLLTLARLASWERPSRAARATTAQVTLKDDLRMRRRELSRFTAAIFEE